MFVFVCVHVRLCVDARVCLCVWTAEVDVRCLLYGHLSIALFETSLSLSLKFTNSQLVLASPGIILSLRRQSCDYTYVATSGSPLSAGDLNVGPHAYLASTLMAEQ